MEYPLEVPLTRSITVDGQVYDKLTFDEMDVGTSLDMQELSEGFSEPPSDKDSRRMSLFLMSRLADVPEAVIRKVKNVDYPAIEKALHAIMTDGEDESAVGNVQGA